MADYRHQMDKRSRGDQVATVPSVSALRELRPSSGEIAYVAGYYQPGDGGAMFLRWDEVATYPADGGLCLEGGQSRGRWLQLHGGIGDFRRFGVMGPEQPADAALEAMVAEPSIQRIEAHTNLNFRARHVFSRSGIEIDLRGHLVTTEGIERNTHDNPFGAVMFFTGKTVDEPVQHTLSAPMTEGVDIFDVGNSARFAAGQFWAVTVNNLTGADERELQLMVEITQIVDTRRVRVGYKTGWPFDAGRTFTWQRIEPVRDVTIGGFRFIGSGPYDGPLKGEVPDDRQHTGSHPVAYEYAVNCHARNIHAERTWWPVIMRRWNTSFSTIACSLTNPPTVFYGGAGYLTQQIYCLYGSTTDCTASNSRHLNDLTASAYCQVKRCHGDGDDAGGNPFTTHGQYEHDLLFEGCSGLMDIANSGPQWGMSAKRITVRQHVCSWFVANTKITDLTLEDLTVLPRPRFDPAATLSVNADGLQMRGCRGHTVAIGQRSSRSARPNVIEGCHFALPAGQMLVQSPVSATVTYRGCLIEGIEGTVLRGTGSILFVSCRLVGVNPDSVLQLGASNSEFRSCALAQVSIELLAAGNQRLVLIGTEVAATAKRGTITRVDTPTAVSVAVHSCTVRSAERAGPAIALTAGANHLRLTDSRCEGGGLTVGGETSTALLARSLLQACPTSLPAGPATVLADCLVLN